MHFGDQASQNKFQYSKLRSKEKMLKSFESKEIATTRKNNEKDHSCSLRNYSWQGKTSPWSTKYNNKMEGI